MTVDLGKNHYWKFSDGIQLALTTGENNTMGEGWIEISSKEYFELAVGQAKLATENVNKTDEFE